MGHVLIYPTPPRRSEQFSIATVALARLALPALPATSPASLENLHRPAVVPAQRRRNDRDLGSSPVLRSAREWLSCRGRERRGMSRQETPRPCVARCRL